MSDDINWFGEKKNIKNKEYKSNSVNFLGSNSKNVKKSSISRNVSFFRTVSGKTTSKKNIKHSNKLKNVNFLGEPSKKKISQNVSFFGLNNNKTPYLFKKESIKKKKLSKWGDADLDGSPNYFDCDPRNAFKDAKKLTGREEEAMLGNVGQKMQDMNQNIKTEKRTNIKNSLKTAGKDFLKSFKNDDFSKDVKKMSQKVRNEREEEYKQANASYKEGKLEPKEYSEIISGLEKGRKIDLTIEKTKNILKSSGLKGKLTAAQFAVEEKRAAGKQPSNKELTTLAKLEKRKKKFGDIQSEGKISREILTKVPMGQFGRVLSGAGVTPSGEYSGELKNKARRVSKMTKIAAGAIFGDVLGGGIGGRYNSEPRPRGRPPGPSGEYKIGGRPVYEQAFQEYASKQNALNRLNPSEQQSAELNPEYIAYLKAKAVADEQGLGEGQQRNAELQQQLTEEGYAMEGEMPTESEMPTTGTSMMQSGQQQELIRQKRAYTRAMPDEIKQAQQQAQQMDNVLKAPNFMKGELKATGGSILTPIGPSILDAPNSFKGEMRNVTKPNIDEGEVKLGDRPQVNSTGNEYLSINLMTGKGVLRRRITEKFMTGESL